MHKNLIKNNSGFAIIEILIGIFIFTMGLISVYLLITSSLNMNLISKNQIIASNLSKEGIELIRNIRDSNYINLHKWNQLNPRESEETIPDYGFVFNDGEYYKIENSFLDNGPTVNITELSDFGEGKTEINGKMLDYRLCLDSNNRYTHDCTTIGNKKTHFYRYLSIKNVENSSGVIDDALQIISKVIWVEKGYHELEIKTILTDWKRL